MGYQMQPLRGKNPDGESGPVGGFNPSVVAGFAEMDRQVAVDLVHRLLRRNVVQLLDERFEVTG